ncbi:MAG: tRNA (adenosine(37)-N6)-threonylcarbamoyltransferase complex dimerization subunit type 1 TsaB [Fidelibacterota bacterium]
MNLLGIETATCTCGVAFVRGERILSEFQIHSERVHSERLAPLLQQIMNNSMISWDEVDGVAVSIGPGSFTGLRIGLGFAKGLCISKNLPLVPVPTLDAMAYNIPFINYYVAALIPCKKEDIYVGLFERMENEVKSLTPYFVVNIDELQLPEERDILAVGEAAVRFSKRLKKRFGERVKIMDGVVSTSIASSVARLGCLRFENRLMKDIGKLEPLYVAEFHI